eukprot:3941828-Rhodomonas_salina.3
MGRGVRRAGGGWCLTWAEGLGGDVSVCRSASAGLCKPWLGLALMHLQTQHAQLNTEEEEDQVCADTLSETDDFARFWGACWLFWCLMFKKAALACGAMLS